MENEEELESFRPLIAHELNTAKERERERERVVSKKEGKRKKVGDRE